MTLGELQKQYLSPSSPMHLAPEDFFVLLSATTGRDKTSLLAHPEGILDFATETKTRSLFARRLTREPVAYITGRKEFYGLDFLVTKETLIPRPETELLVELVLEEAKRDIILQPQNDVTHIIDIGTGSGNIIISLAHTLHEAFAISGHGLPIIFAATDISTATLDIARLNAKQQNLEKNIHFIESDLLSSIPKIFFSANKTILTANLPYLSEEIYAASADDVKKFEPRGALISGDAGLAHYHRFLRQVSEYFMPQQHIMLFLEIGPEQSILIKREVHSFFPQADVIIHPDLSGRDRIVMIDI